MDKASAARYRECGGTGNHFFADHEPVYEPSAAPVDLLLGMDPEECERKAAWHELQAAAWRQIAAGVRLYRGEQPERRRITSMIRQELDSNDRVKASDLRRAAGGSKSVDTFLRRLVDRGEVERLGDGWYRKVVA